MANKHIVLIPTYNEINNINNLAGRILALGENLDILVIDDNSPDGTGEEADALSKKHPEVKVLHNRKKSGLGKAYIQGFNHALSGGYEYIFTMDADFSHNPDMLRGLKSGLYDSDLVIGSRYVPGGAIRNWPLRRLFLSRMGNLYARLVTGIRIKDCTAGFMGMRSRLLENIDINGINSEGYGFLIEIKYRAWKKNMRLSEIPIVFAERTDGKSKLSKNIIWEALFLVWKLRKLKF